MEFKTTTLEAAYAALGETRFEIPSSPGLPEEKRIYLQAQLDLPVFIEAINMESNGGKKWLPDYTNNQETKYEPWFWIKKSDTHPSGFVFSRTDYDYSGTYAYCGSRFAFHSVNAWQHAMNTPAVIDLFLTVWAKKD